MVAIACPPCQQTADRTGDPLRYPPQRYPETVRQSLSQGLYPPTQEPDAYRRLPRRRTRRRTLEKDPGEGAGDPALAFRTHLPARDSAALQVSRDTIRAVRKKGQGI